MMKRLVIITILLIAGAALFSLYVNDRLKMGGDIVDIIRLAESLRHGNGYTIEGQFSSTWPPVMPLILAITISLFGLSVTVFKAIGALFGLAGLLAAYALLCRHGESRLALLAVLLSAVMFPFIYWVVDVSSEAPFFCLTMIALLCAQRLTDDRPHWGWAVALGLATGLSILTRIVGISLLAALALWGIAGWFRKTSPPPRQAALTVLVALAIAGAWFGYSRLQIGMTGFSVYGNLAGKSDIYETQPTTKSPVKLLVARTVANSVGYAFIFANPDSSQRIKAKNRFTPLSLVSVGIMALATAGFLYHLIKRPGLPEWYVLSYGGLLLTYVWYDIRYVVPLFPLLFYYLIFSADRIFHWLADKLGKGHLAPVATIVAIGLFIAANLGVSLLGPQAKRLRAKEYSGAAKEIYDAAQWIKQNQPDAVVMSRQANMVGFWTQLQARSIPLISDPEKMWRHVEKNRIGFIIVDPDEFSGVTTKYLGPAIETYPERFEIVAKFGRTSVYKVHTEPVIE